MAASARAPAQFQAMFEASLARLGAAAVGALRFSGESPTTLHSPCRYQAGVGGLAEGHPASRLFVGGTTAGNDRTPPHHREPRPDERRRAGAEAASERRLKSAPKRTSNPWERQGRPSSEARMRWRPPVRPHCPAPAVAVTSLCILSARRLGRGSMGVRVAGCGGPRVSCQQAVHRRPA